MGRPRELTAAERESLIAKGFKPVEMWVPDLDNPKMMEDLKRQANAAAEADEKDEIFEWLAAVHAFDMPDDRH